MKERIQIEYSLNDDEYEILSILEKFGVPITVHQIHVILKFRKKEISPMKIWFILNSLTVLGLVKKYRKNSRIYEYEKA
ncbi:hypothetical protein [Picrophilus oshimae]|uniref:MarR family transcriptional regulator n=1 Tax=Picrophilus torridus (strain ATCC 700027 / DSM 9790 / JCM 10055 / NBRC 100828 / KAW 2/3) TaxID=1122961 RepID=Q6L258_PICTO|nr:hypothetical protein [Picrophilus oshimae]AAT42944.1 hypothetical protein PTO0359 [Picrophilus oshimae DSM 9789]